MIPEAGATKHPARELPEAERIDYLSVVASLVLADHEVDEKEIARLRDLCRTLGVSDAGQEAVLAAAARPEPEVLDEILARLKRNVPLRYSLLTDAVVIVFADGKVADAEPQEIARLGRALEVAPFQIGLISRYVESVILGRAGHSDEQALSRELGLGLVAEGRGAVGPGAAAIRWLHNALRPGAER